MRCCCSSKNRTTDGNGEPYNLRRNDDVRNSKRAEQETPTTVRSQAEQVQQQLAEDTRTAAGDVNIAQPVEEANDSQSTSSRALSAEAVPLEEIAHAVFNYDDGLAELITLEEMYMKYLEQTEEYEARMLEDEILMASEQEIDVLFGDTQYLISIQQTISSSLSKVARDSREPADLASSLLHIAATYWNLSDSLKLQAISWVERRTFCQTMTTGHPELLQFTCQCEEDELLPLDIILTFPFDRLSKYVEIFPRLQKLAVSEGLEREANSLRETLNAIERVIDAVMKADDMSRKFENMWKTTLVMHNVWNPSIQSHPISLSHHASFKWETLPTDVSTYLEKTGRSLCDLDVHCFLFEKLLIALCVVDEEGSQFFGYVYPLSHVAVNSIHLNANVWSVYRYDLKYCELTLRSSSQADKWKTINLIREKARQNGCMRTEEQEAEFVLYSAHRATKNSRRQLYFIMKELVDTETTYVKILDVLMTCYLLPLRAERLLSLDETDTVCCNLECVVSWQRMFLEAIETALYETNDVRQIVTSVCKAFIANMDHFQKYVDYIVNLSEANYILANKHGKLGNFLAQQRPSEEHAMSFHSLLMTPFQRLLRYPLVLKSAIACTSNESGWQDEVELLKMTVTEIEGICREANERKRKRDKENLQQK